MKRTVTFILGAMCTFSVSAVFAAESPVENQIWENAQVFASQYPYKEGDTEKSFSLYPDVNYTSGIETRSDGIEYECPAIYRDVDATMMSDFDLEKGDMSLVINGQMSDFGGSCVLYNGTTLVPVDTFSCIGCDIEIYANINATKLSKDETILEIMPYLIGMRKNQADGYYVPLKACARYVDGELYIPLRAVAEEFGINVDWDGMTHTVFLYF